MYKRENAYFFRKEKGMQDDLGVAPTLMPQKIVPWVESAYGFL
jgi:hypothetical protein